MDIIRTVVQKYEAEIEVTRSKFIGYLFPCSTQDQFEQQLFYIKKEHSNARHHCYAYRMYDPILVERYQDDKEPSGTAGMPILEVMKGNNISQCAIVVVRYFGGVKLGTGGLSRAYSDAAREVFHHSDIVKLETGVFLNFSVDYNLGGKFDHYFLAQGITVADIGYDTMIRYSIVVLEENLASVVNQITELSSGSVMVDVQKKELGYFLINKFVPFSN